MSAFLIIIHVVVSLALIMIVLLQTGKGADMGAAFGGGSSQTLFGTSGASSVLSKATTMAAVIFMITCFSLAYLSTKGKNNSIMKDVTVPAAEKTVKETPKKDSKPSATNEKPVSKKEVTNEQTETPATTANDKKTVDPPPSVEDTTNATDSSDNTTTEKKSDETTPDTATSTDESNTTEEPSDSQ